MGGELGRQGQEGGLALPHAFNTKREKGRRQEKFSRGLSPVSHGRDGAGVARNQRSSAANEATSLRSQAVKVMWPKQRWPRKAPMSTARALLDSPRYGASI